MSLQRAFCIHCKTENERVRIFDTNSEAEVCYCPHCGTKQLTEDAITNYKKFIAMLLKKANKTMYELTDFNHAYEQFAHIIEIDDRVYKARYGRIICLIFMSTVRKPLFNNALALFESEKSSHFYKRTIDMHYERFLYKLNNAIDEYLSLFPQKLKVSNCFYDIDCLRLYYKNVNEALNFKKVILDEVKELKDKDSCNNKALIELYKNLKNSIAKIKENLKGTHELVDGFSYTYQRTYKGNLYFKKSESVELAVATKKIKKKSLTYIDSKTSLIKERVFPDNMKIFISYKRALPEFIVCASLGAISLIIAICLKNLFSIIFGVFSLMFFIGTITLIILSVYWKKLLVKRRHLIN